ncbi:hypothetical protein B0J17DRAFT_82231 [Rhizoctonia solani]|nr:hypothetical protein B0J17DRAFT_82231 [Rhizoctonia solani]
MAPSQPLATSSPHPAHTAGPSTISSSSTSPTGTHSTVATTVGNAAHRQRSWDEDKNLNLYILDYCRRRKFDETASIFEREAGIPSDSKVSFDAPQGLLFEWWIVFWETFNSQRSNPNLGPSGQRESGQVYVNTMARLRKLAMHEKDEQHRARSMSMSMPNPGMPNPMMGGMGPVMNGSGPASAMSTPAMGNMPNPMGGPRPQSQASARMPQQPGMGQPGQQPMGPGASGQPGMPPQQGPNMGQMNGPGPQQPGPPQPGMQQGQPRPQQPGMMGPGMTPNMTHASTPHASTPHASTPSAPHTHVSSSPSPVPTPPQNFSGGGPGPQQPPFNSQFNPSQPQFSAPGGPGQGPFPGQPGGPGQFPGGPGNNTHQFRFGPGQNGPPGQNAPFPPNSGPGFQPNAGGQNFGPGQQGFQPGPVPQQPFPSGPGGPQFPSGSGMNNPGGPGGPGGFPPGVRQGPGLPFQNGQPPEWAQRPPAMGPGGPEPGRRPDGSWEDGRPRPGGMMVPQGKMGAPHPQMQRYLGQPGPGGPPHMMGPQPGMGGGPQQPQQMGGPMPSPKEDARSVTPQQTQPGWNPEGGISMQRRPGVAAQGGQMGPRPGFNPQGQGQGGQKRPGSPPPPVAAANPGGSPPEKRLRPNDPGPGVLVDSRGADGRPSSSKGGVPFPGQGMNGQPNPQTQQKINQYAHELRGVTQEMRGQILRQGGPQPPPFGKGPQQQTNGGNPGRGPRPPDAPSPVSGGEGPGQPRQLTNVKGQASNAMGPPVSPSLTHRNVGGVKKSESAGSSPALQHSTVSNGMNPDRSHTPQQMKQGGSQSPMPAPMTRPQSAQPTMNQGPSLGIPPPPGSAPPILAPTQSPSNGMLPFNTKFDQHFDFGPEMDFTGLTSEFFPDMDPMLGLGDWAEDS